MIAEALIIGISIIVGFWILAKSLVSICEAFLKYLKYLETKKRGKEC